MIIDTHQHFWKLDRRDYAWLSPDLEPLYRDFLPEDLKPILRETGVGGTIAVQAADSEAETEYLLSQADQNDWILGVVGWVDLEAPHAVASIKRLVAHPKLVGLRPMIQDIEDDAWMLKDALKPGIEAMIEHDLTFDALVMPRHLEYLKSFLMRYPDLCVVVDHCAKPEIRRKAFEPWASQIKVISEFSNVFCKISGLVTEANAEWEKADLMPYIEHVIKVFGPRRIMFGSDWPVLCLQSSYSQWHDLVLSQLKALSEHDQNFIMTETALKAYPRVQRTRSE